MVKDEKTILDTEETIPNSDKTVLDAETGDANLPDNRIATMPDDATALDGEEGSNGGDGAPVIEQGASLLDTYRVKSNVIEGGMGGVWRVHHTGWNVDLAMKRPKAILFQSEKQKENFIRECDAWIKLGLHPHIVSCYYVRRIGDIPTIFSEWMEGGSLKNAIEDGMLYEGNAAERILDIAIQFVRGLHYAHEQGLIHQDVKPDNLLLTKDWDAKVADFGIAKARATLTVLDADIPTDATMFSASGGYTPAYCSMEQMNGEQLTRRTDIYSWAVSVLEMYLGNRLWQNGVIAGAACEEYFSDAKVTIPQKMQELLSECLNAKEAARPRDFAEVEKRLLEIYREEVGEEYPRPVSKAAADTADSLNNRALSYIDLGKADEAEMLWKRALLSDQSHASSLYNFGLYKWRKGETDDRAAVVELENAWENTPNDWKPGYYICRLHLERADAQQATSVLERAAKSGMPKNFQKELRTQIQALKPEKLMMHSPTDPWVATLSADQECRYLVSTHAYSPEAFLERNKQYFCLWDAKSGKEIRKFHAPDGWDVRCARLSEDGALTASAGYGGVSVWDTITGECLQHFAARNAVDVYIAPNGKSVVSNDGAWDASTGAVIQEPYHENDAFDSCSVKVDYANGNGTLFRLESRNSRYDGHGPRLLDQSGRCLRTLVVGDGRDVYCAYPDVERNRAFFGTDNGIYGYDLPEFTYSAQFELSRIFTVDVQLELEREKAALLLQAENALNENAIAECLVALKKARELLGSSDDKRILALSRKAGRFCRVVGLYGVYKEKTKKHHAMQQFISRMQPENLMKQPRDYSRLNLDCQVKPEKGKITVHPDGYYSKKVVLFEKRNGRPATDFSSGYHFLLNNTRNYFIAYGYFCKETERMGTTRICWWPVGRPHDMHETVLPKLAHLQMGPDGNYLLAGFRGKFWKLNFVSGELCDFGLNSIDNDGLYYDDGLLLCGGGKGALYFGGDLVVSYANFQTGANKSFNVNRSLHLPSVDAIAEPTGRFAICIHTDMEVFDLEKGESVFYRKLKERTGNILVDQDGDICVYEDESYHIFRIDWEYQFPGFTDWDEGAQLYLNTFLARYPHWEQEEFDGLIQELQDRGYGYIRPEGVRKKLLELADAREPKKKKFHLFGKNK